MSLGGGVGVPVGCSPPSPPHVDTPMLCDLSVPLFLRLCLQARLIRGHKRLTPVSFKSTIWYGIVAAQTTSHIWQPFLGGHEPPGGE